MTTHPKPCEKDDKRGRASPPGADVSAAVVTDTAGALAGCRPEKEY